MGQKEAEKEESQPQKKRDRITSSRVSNGDFLSLALAGAAALPKKKGKKTNGS